MTEEDIKKIKDLVSFYFNSNKEVIVKSKAHKNLEIEGTIEQYEKGFMGWTKQFIIIDGMKIFLEDIEDNGIYPAKMKEKEKPDIPGRKGIGKSMKFAVWDRYFGERLRGKCLCCGVQEISRDDCEMCHIISVAEGGETNVNNLKPGCKDCNRSMGTMNFDEYKKEFH